jgi:hypothetical protein
LVRTLLKTYDICNNKSSIAYGIFHITNQSTLIYNEDLDGEKHNEQDVRTLVQCIPGALPYDYELAELPIQRAARTVKNALFISLFAEEGAKHNVGGKGMRDGLLKERRTVA